MARIKNPLKLDTAYLYLMLGMFFNPFGFDIIFAIVLKLTGSFLATDIIFYFTSIFFFILSYISKKKKSKLEKHATGS